MASFRSRWILGSGLLAIAVASAAAQELPRPPNVISYPASPAPEWRAQASPDTPATLINAVIGDLGEPQPPPAFDPRLPPGQIVSDTDGGQSALGPLPEPNNGPQPPARIVNPATQSAPATCAPSGTFMERCRRRWQALFLGYPDQFESPPLGQSVNAHFKVQVENGDAARMVLYDYDFVRGTANLNQRGKDQLAKIAELLPRNFHYVIVERTPANPQLAEARRVAILNDLAQRPFPIPQERVVVGAPIATGVSGTESELLYQNILDQLKSGSPGSSGTVGVGQTQPAAPQANSR